MIVDEKLPRFVVPDLTDFKVIGYCLFWWGGGSHFTDLDSMIRLLSNEYQNYLLHSIVSLFAGRNCGRQSIYFQFQHKELGAPVPQLRLKMRICDNKKVVANAKLNTLVISKFFI